jgi:hypothetical protein
MLTAKLVAASRVSVSATRAGTSATHARGHGPASSGRCRGAGSEGAQPMAGWRQELSEGAASLAQATTAMRELGGPDQRHGTTTGSVSS